MIPLPFLTAAVAFTLWISFKRFSPGATISHWLSAAWLVGALQHLLIGCIQFYELDVLVWLRPIGAVLIPILWWAAIVQPPVLLGMSLSAIAAVVVLTLGAWEIDWLDPFIVCVFLYVSIAILRLSWASDARVPWLNLQDPERSRRHMRVVASLLFVSAIFDGVIAYWFATGQSVIATQAIVVAQLISIVSLYMLLLINPESMTVGLSESTELAARRPEVERALFEHVERVMIEQSLYLDPNLNLLKIARKAGVVSREVSAAVNMYSGQNLSQWVNGFRIEQAQRLLKETDQSILDIMEAVGFTTKSSFNREFKRVRGVTPSVFRQSA
ncbi:MAG: helix-turn-helix transcriptional regulator [Gammaproteobacteria bacterium]|nr:helix-turn-helix transcriptional regulator [Gammaproteobacteria bacterium]